MSLSRTFMSLHVALLLVFWSMVYSGGNATVIHWDITIIGELDDWGSTNVLELKAQCTTVHTGS